MEPCAASQTSSATIVARSAAGGAFKSIRDLMHARKTLHLHIEAMRQQRTAGGAPLEFVGAPCDTEAPTRDMDDGQSLTAWSMLLHLTPDDDIEVLPSVPPFEARYGSRTTTVTVVVKFNATDPDAEAPMIRILSPRIVGPHLFHGVVCAIDIASGEWRLSKTFDVLMTLRAHLIQQCAADEGSLRHGGGGHFSDAEASDGAAYIASLHPEWGLQSSGSPAALAQARALVEDAAASTNEATALSQELQRIRALAAAPPLMVAPNQETLSQMEATILRLRETALVKLTEAASIVQTGEILQRRACALFAMDRVEDAYAAFHAVRERYTTPGDDSGWSQGGACAALYYELAHCSLRLGQPRRAMEEALVAVRCLPPGPFAGVLDAIASAVAKEEEAHVFAEYRATPPRDAEGIQSFRERGHDVVLLAHQLVEISPNNPRALGLMSLAEAMRGDARSASMYLDAAMTQAHLDPIGMCVLRLPLLTMEQQAAWTEHCEMIAGWMITRGLIHDATMRHLNSHVYPRLREATHQHNAAVENIANETHNLMESRTAMLVHEMTSSLTMLFSAVDAAALVSGAGRCEANAAAEVLQLYSLVNQFGPPPPYGSLLNITGASDNQCSTESDGWGVAVRTVLPHQLDALLDFETVTALRGDLLGPVFRLELLDRPIPCHAAAAHPHRAYDSRAFRQMIAVLSPITRQQYYLHVRAAVQHMMVERLQPLLVRIARNRLAAKCQLSAIRIVEGAGDLPTARELAARLIETTTSPGDRLGDSQLEHSTGGLVAPYLDEEMLAVAAQYGLAVPSHATSVFEAEGASSCALAAPWPCPRCIRRQLHHTHKECERDAAQRKHA